MADRDDLDLMKSDETADIDFVAVYETLKKNQSNQTFAALYKDEDAIVDVSPDKMEALIQFQPPTRLGLRMSGADIRQKIADRGVVYGLREGKLRLLTQNRDYRQSYCVARGMPPTPGEDGYLRYHFDRSAPRPKPKILEDGTVDFHQLGLLQQCNAGEILVSAIPPADGTDGMDVLGNVIPFGKGKLPPPLPKGKNVHVSKCGDQLISAVSGRIAAENGTVSVLPVVEVRGNVDHSTGDVVFRGAVVVWGNVKSGFAVEAENDVEIRGVVEDGAVRSESDVILRGGANSKAVIYAKGNVTARFIENCSVTAGGNIKADSILHSHIQCGGSLVLSGKNGVLAGGKVTVFDKIIANTIGSAMAALTEIEVGHDPLRAKEYEEVSAEIKALKKEYEAADKAVENINAQAAIHLISDKRKSILVRALYKKTEIRNKLEHARSRRDELQPYMGNQNGLVRVSQMMHYSVKVTIGDAVMYIKDRLPACVLTNHDSMIDIKTLP
ncbi:MAG: FapA family protein [Clostridiales bacterium]|jgi:uncharacterized protein (DUF342 family)|nr:FapA family protein [Clostridiales bacterium]